MLDESKEKADLSHQSAIIRFLVLAKVSKGFSTLQPVSNSFDTT
ncbi:hypothetical protein RV10_GL000941 [Enterococcus pallens]|nr:hypothetical protein RV10_GL000941 [Enterococcus pallens]